MRGRVLTLVVIMAWSAIASGAESPALSEYQIKAAFLYNFAKFVEWPAGALSERSPTLTFCVLGEDPFGADLDQTIAGKTINGKSLVTRRLKPLQEAEGCHILFISASERRRLPQIFEALQGLSLLTVGESERFARLGGIINFTLEQNKIRFEINVDAAERTGLKLSAKLLKLATIVRDRDSN